MTVEVFGMRRANGDWFALELDYQRRVLVFRSLLGGWRARAKNQELMLFWPAPVDERALAEFATASNEHAVGFWLVDEDDPAADLRRGHPLEYMQVATLERLKEWPLRTKRRWQSDEGAGGKAWAFS